MHKNRTHSAFQCIFALKIDNVLARSYFTISGRNLANILTFSNYPSVSLAYQLCYARKITPRNKGLLRGSMIYNFRYKSPSPAPPLPPHQSRSAMHHPFLQGNGESSLKRRVQSPRRRDFKDFSTPRDFRSPNRFNGNEAFLLPGYALSPDEDEDSGADSLNEHMSKNLWVLTAIF